METLIPSILLVAILGVLIVPRWNGNTMFNVSGCHLVTCLNRTKVEWKQSEVAIDFLSSLHVLIVPRWNGNRMNESENFRRDIVLIVPRWNGNDRPCLDVPIARLVLIVPRWNGNIGLKFVFDKDAIGLNRTKVEWKLVPQ